jgi:hypothetical protein
MFTTTLAAKYRREGNGRAVNDKSLPLGVSLTGRPMAALFSRSRNIETMMSS